ncbi:tRNA pseudouridine synthase 1 [Lecanora helva]
MEIQSMAKPAIDPPEKQTTSTMAPAPTEARFDADLPRPNDKTTFHSSQRKSGVRGKDRERGNPRGHSKGRGGHNGRGRRDEKSSGHKKRDQGRAEWSRNQVDKRARNEANQEAAKRRKLEGIEDELPIYATKFSQEEIDAQGKKPKRKVAVMIGYSGSGYKGMQLNHREKTIEGDLFSAFVSAGAISKANADDPKKSSLVRCARTDKGVHAAGNLISLKLIVEDSDVVAKINQALSPQIRVWGIERTNGSFNAYQFCDSRIYEYLIPTHCFLPPHPKSFLGKMMMELATEANDMESYLARQEEVADFWSKVEEKYEKQALDKIDPAMREAALNVFYGYETIASTSSNTIARHEQKPGNHDALCPDQNQSQTIDSAATGTPKREEVNTSGNPNADDNNAKQPSSLENAIRHLKSAHITAKKAYRIHPARLARVRSCLSRFEGSFKYHNYTVDKTYKDPSATRIIKTFKVGEKPIVIGDTEWLSLKVHGQSFMMHQIRKMVSMAALIVRCGCHEGRIQDSYMANKLSIPKAPSLGLLLERPVFDVYNERLEQFGRERIDFSRHEKEMEEFKQRQIYERIFREEEESGCFHSFFTALDNTRSAQLLYLSSVGVNAVKREIPREGPAKEVNENVDVDRVSSDDEGGIIDEG